MTPLLRRLSRRHFVRHPWQALLAVLGVSLGVAVVVSIDLANDSALRAFSLSSEAVTGRATHRIVGGPTGVSEELWVELRLRLGVRSSAPVVQGYVGLRDRPGRALQVLGVDPFSEGNFRSYLDQGTPDLDVGRLLTEPGAVWLSPSTAAELGLRTEDTFTLEVAGAPTEVRLAGLLEPHDLRQEALTDLVVTDISTAQELLGIPGRLTRIDLLLDEPAARDLAPRLPAGVVLEAASAAGELAGEMTGAFRTNLQALSLLALLCGAFLIYNTVSFAVVQRRQLFGGLRALGVTRREILSVVLGEALLVGLIGATLGLFGGILLGRGLVGQVTRTINDLYFAVAVQGLALEPMPLIKGALLGVGASLLAALAPAVEAMSTSPRAALDRAELESRAHKAVPKATLAGCALLLAGVVLLALPASGLAASFAGLFALLLGFALLTPAATMLLIGLLTPLAGLLFGQLGRLGGRGVVAALSRTAVAVSALMIAVSVIVGVDVMVRSFRDTVESWLEYSLPADLYLSAAAAPTAGLAGARPGFDPEFVDRLTALEDIDGMSLLRQTTARTPAGEARLIALDLDRRSYDSFAFKEGDAERLWTAFEAGEAVIVSEPYATRTGVGVGSKVELLTTSGPRTWPVAAIYFDYASEQGTITLARQTYLELWQDPAVTAISIRMRPGASADQLTAAIREAGGDRQLLIRSNQAIREESLEVFDRTFLITGTLRLLATLVAFVGVLSALMALQLERARELGVLRAQGLTPGQVWSLVTSQTGLMGLTAGLLSLPVGITTAAVMIYVINRRSFGWTLEMQLSPAPLVTAIAVALGAALLAGVYPAYRMARTSPAEALRSE
jgi:putative ABC transport system permease protein